MFSYSFVISIRTIQLEFKALVTAWTLIKTYVLKVTNLCFSNQQFAFRCWSLKSSDNHCRWVSKKMCTHENFNCDFD